MKAIVSKDGDQWQVDYGVDLDFHTKYFKTEKSAKKFARNFKKGRMKLYTVQYFENGKWRGLSFIRRRDAFNEIENAKRHWNKLRIVHGKKIIKTYNYRKAKF